MSIKRSMHETIGEDVFGFNLYPPEPSSKKCLWCGATASIKDWAIPGLWVMGLFQCSGCDRSIWSDLDYGVGALAPIQIDADTSEGRRLNGHQWYVDLTTRAYQSRVSKPVTISVEGNNDIRTGLLFNCLHPWWGDTVSLILRTNLLKDSGIPIIVLTTRDAAWLIPNYVSQTWIVEDNVSSSVIWNEGLAQSVKELASRFESLQIPTVFQPANLTREDIECLTGVAPFKRSDWMDVEPTFGFVYRSDRCWIPPVNFLSKLPERLKKIIKQRYTDEQQQMKQLIQCFQQVKRCIPNARFVCFGLRDKNRVEPLPNWIEDHRTSVVGVRENKMWCEMAAKCHVIVGVLGSHMTLPSFYAGSVVDLMPQYMASLVLTDIGIVCNDTREALFLYRVIPSSIDSFDLASVIVSIYANAPYALMALSHSWYRPISRSDLEQLIHLREKRHDFLKNNISNEIGAWLGP